MDLKEYTWRSICLGYLPEPRRHRRLGKLLDETLVTVKAGGEIVEYWTTKQTKVVVRCGRALFGKPAASGYTFDEYSVSSDGKPGVSYVSNGLLPSAEEVEEMVKLLTEKEG